jgi:hypothetical protein
LKTLNDLESGARVQFGSIHEYPIIWILAQKYPDRVTLVINNVFFRSALAHVHGACNMPSNSPISEPDRDRVVSIRKGYFSEKDKV